MGARPRDRTEYPANDPEGEDLGKPFVSRTTEAVHSELGALRAETESLRARIAELARRDRAKE